MAKHSHGSRAENKRFINENILVADENRRLKEGIGRLSALLLVYCPRGDSRQASERPDHLQHVAVSEALTFLSEKSLEMVPVEN